MNKLTALQILNSAYWYVRDVYGNADTAHILRDKFHLVRRSMQNLDELRPVVATMNEGTNGRMPTFF
jgi:hypothetical protein